MRAPQGRREFAVFGELLHFFLKRFVIDVQSQRQGESADAHLGAVDQPPSIGQSLQADPGGELRDVQVDPRKTISQGQLDDFTLVPGDAERRRI